MAAETEIIILRRRTDEAVGRMWVQCADCGDTQHVHEDAYRCLYCRRWMCSKCASHHFAASHPTAQSLEDAK